jgi:type I restriction enzyme M protein
MCEQDDVTEIPQTVAEASNPDNFFFDLLTGDKESATPKKLLVMQDLMRQDPAKGRGIERVHKVGIVEERDPVSGHGLDRPALSSFQTEQERAEEGMVEQQGGPRLLETPFDGRVCFHAAAPM